MAKNTQGQPAQPGTQTQQQPAQQGQGGVQALDWNKLLQALQTLGAVAPIAYEAFMAILDKLKQPSPVMAQGASGAGHRCPDEHLCDCHQQLIENLSLDLALAIHCCYCCSPDAED
jgi:hypothetical protein